MRVTVTMSPGLIAFNSFNSSRRLPHRLRN
jgi:hypothetical protein